MIVAFAGVDQQKELDAGPTALSSSLPDISPVRFICFKNIKKKKMTFKFSKVFNLKKKKKSRLAFEVKF